MSLNGRIEVGLEFEADRTSREVPKEAKDVGLGNNRRKGSRRKQLKGG